MQARVCLQHSLESNKKSMRLFVKQEIKKRKNYLSIG